MESAKRNKEWMKNLYNKRGEIYEKIVTEELEMIENNALLNALANEGIYISVDDFANWKNNGIPPSEFYDHSRKIIIPEGTELYDKYYSFFEQAAELREQRSTTVPESLDKELQRKLDELDAQMQAEIANVPKKEVRVDGQKIYPTTGNEMSPTYLYNQMGAEQYAEADYGGEFPMTLFRDSEGKLKLDNNEGEEIDPSVIAVDFESAQLFRMESQPDPELVKPIEERYENLKNQVKQEYANKLEEAKAEAQKPSEEFVPVTADMELEEIQQHKELYNQLYNLFNDKYLSTLSTEEDIELSEDPIKMRNAFTKFLQTDIQAKKLINEFNKNMKLEEVTKETGEKEEFEFIYQGKKINTADIKTVYDLRKMQRRFKNLIAEIEKVKEPTPAQITDKSNYMVIVNDLEKLIATRSKKGFTPELQEAIKKIQELKERQGEIEQTPAGYKIDGEIYRRVTQVIQDLKGEKYEYTDAKSVAVAFYNNIGDEALSIENIGNFIQALRVSSLSGFSAFTYNELQKELEDILNTGKISTSKKTEAKIFNPIKGEIKSEENIVFGAAGKMGKTESRQNQDAVFVDKNKGLFIVVDGMGGVDKVPFFQPHDAAKLMVNEFRGVKEKNPFDIIVDAYKSNNNITPQEIFKLLQDNNYIPKSEKYDDSSVMAIGDMNIIAIKSLLRILKDPNSITDNDNWLTRAVGAVGVKAQKIGNNKYEIEHVGDAVFFVVDKNNNIKQAQGLSTSPFVDGFTWGIDASGNISADPAKKISKYTVELKPGERLVLASDFIETKEAIQDFINAGFGKNLDFDEFRKNHKNDDASFISIGYEDATATTSTENIDPQNLLNRIQQIVSEKTYEESRISGNYIDEQVKRLFDGSQPVEFNEDLITQEAYDNLFGPDGFLTKLKQRVDNGELYIVSQGIRVFDKELKIAGEIDLLVADTAGNITIVDVKTGEKSKWDNFKKKGNRNSKMEDYQLQQTAYANLLDRMIGYNPKVALLPVQMTREKETGKILSAGKPTSPTLLSTDFLIFLDKAPVQERIDSIIPRPETKVEPEITPAQIVPENAESSDDVESPAQKARTDIKAKEADIERRRKMSLEDNIIAEGTYYLPGFDPNNLASVAENTEQVYGETAVEIREKLNAKYDAELAALKQQAPEEGPYISEEIRYDLKDFQKDLENANTVDELKALRADLSIKIAEERITFEDLQEMGKLFNEKLQKVKEGETKITPESIKAGDQLISKTAIFEEGTGRTPMVATEGSTFVVNSVDNTNKTVSVSPMGWPSKVNISFDKLNEMFILKDTVMASTEQEPVTITQEEKELLSQSTDLADALMKDAVKLEELENIAAKKTIKDLDSELLNDLKC
jgi:hypothetical protein